MRVLFAGPSLYGINTPFIGLDRRHPARHGDVFAAVEQGATVIGLIDGYFGWTAATWHKEILYALSHGVRVLGAASMGALRAAECAYYGMEPVGGIANAYLDGTLVDDDEVALVHGPEEMGFMPLTDALVDSRATLDALSASGLITSEEHRILVAAAHRIHFTERDADSIARKSGLPSPRVGTVAELYRTHHISRKQRDALALVEMLQTCRAERTSPPAGWSFVETPIWKRAFRGDLAA